MSHENSSSTAVIPSHPESAAMIPASFAEKAMASVLQLHSELMEEKEKRVDLYRRLMDKEQAVVELKSYVKVLEERLAMATTATATASARVTSQTQGARIEAKPAVTIPSAAGTPGPTSAARPDREGKPAAAAPAAKASSAAAVPRGAPSASPDAPSPVRPPPLDAALAAARARRATREMPAVQLPATPLAGAGTEGAIPSKVVRSPSVPSGSSWAPHVPASAVLGPKGRDLRLDGWKSW